MTMPDQAQVEIQHLRLEVARLEHALTSAKLLTALVAAPTVIRPLDLTTREREVLGRLIEGETSQQIGDRLYLGLDTVKYHVGKLMRKFDTHTRTGVVTAAVRAGFVPEQREA